MIFKIFKKTYLLKLKWKWDCNAQLSYGVQFEKLRITCEGYDYPDDPFVLVDSCGVIQINFKIEAYFDFCFT